MVEIADKFSLFDNVGVLCIIIGLIPAYIYCIINMVDNLNIKSFFPILLTIGLVIGHILRTIVQPFMTHDVPLSNIQNSVKVINNKVQFQKPPEPYKLKAHYSLGLIDNNIYTIKYDEYFDKPYLIDEDGNILQITKKDYETLLEIQKKEGQTNDKL